MSTGRNIARLPAPSPGARSERSVSAASIPPIGPHPIHRSPMTRTPSGEASLWPTTTTSPQVRASFPAAISSRVRPCNLHLRLVNPHPGASPASQHVPAKLRPHLIPGDGVSPTARQEPDDRRDSPVKVSEVELLIRCMEIVIRQPKPHHHRRDLQLAHEVPDDRDRPAPAHKHRLPAPDLMHSPRSPPAHTRCPCSPRSDRPSGSAAPRPTPPSA